MSLKQWPVAERPREKLIEFGAARLSDAELLAIFIRTGVKGHSALDIARRLLLEYGSLSALLNTSFHQFSKTPGLGLAKYAQIQASMEISRRCLKESMLAENYLTNSTATRQYLQSQLQHRKIETFACLFLNNQHGIIAFKELFHGSIDRSAVYPREVVKMTLNHHAAAVIFAHNHPSGIAEPSTADIEITNRLCQALNLIDVRVLDHIIIADTQTISFSERGLMPGL